MKRHNRDFVIGVTHHRLRPGDDAEAKRHGG
jgi:hypothetical protein